MAHLLGFCSSGITPAGGASSRAAASAARASSYSIAPRRRCVLVMAVDEAEGEAKAKSNSESKSLYEGPAPGMRQVGADELAEQKRKLCSCQKSGRRSAWTRSLKSRACLDLHNAPKR